MPVASLNLTFSSRIPFPTSKHSLKFPQFLRIKCAEKAKRTGKLRYPSEKKKLRKQQPPKIEAPTTLEGVWRLSRLGVSVHDDPGKDFWGVSEALLKEIAKILEFPVASMLPPEAFKVVRKSFDARKIVHAIKVVGVPKLKPSEASKSLQDGHVIHHDELEYCCNFFPKKFTKKQALGGHQNAHKFEKTAKERVLEGLEGNSRYIGDDSNNG